jgi:multicomponent Na+:H+ antiporter subunit D
MTLAVLPILIPVLMMIIHLLIRKDSVAAISGITGSMLLLVSSGFIAREVFSGDYLSLVAGGWDAPFGISIVIDPMSAMFLVVSSVIVLSISVFCIAAPGQEKAPDQVLFFLFLPHPGH